MELSACYDGLKLHIMVISFILFSATLQIADAQDACGAIGHNDQTAAEPLRNTKLYLDIQNSAPCAGTISNWTYCYYAPLFRFAAEYITTFALYRKIKAENGNDDVYSRVSLIFEARRSFFNWQANQQEDVDFYCNNVTLNYTVPVEQGDVIGACVFDPTDDFLIRREPLNLVGRTSLNYSVLEYNTNVCTRASLPSNVPSNEFRLLGSTILHLSADIDPLPVPPLAPEILTSSSKQTVTSEVKQPDSTTTEMLYSTTQATYTLTTTRLAMPSTILTPACSITRSRLVTSNNVMTTINLRSSSLPSVVTILNSIEPSPSIRIRTATIEHFSDTSAGSIDITEQTKVLVPDDGKDGGGLSNGVIIGNILAFLVLIIVAGGIIFIVVMWKRKQGLYSTHKKITATVRLQSNAAVTNLHSHNEDELSESFNSNPSLVGVCPTSERYDHLPESTFNNNTTWSSPMHEYATLGPYEEMQPAAPLAIYETSAGSAVYANIFEQNKYEDIYDGLEPYRAPATVEQDLYAQLKSYGIKNIPRLQIQPTGELGSGQFGTVEQGLWRNVDGNSEVAVKMLNGTSSDIDKVKFLQEAAIMAQFRHPNVVFLYGVVSKGDPLMLVIELAHKGDLNNYLVKIANTELAPQASGLLLDFCQQIALGMQYLAGKGYVHRDLAARNVLVSKMDTCKIADFGMSRDLADETYYVSRGGVIPVKWTAPEALHYKKYSTASDVWSYGCLLYEIWSLGRKPYEGLRPVDVISHVDSGRRLPPPPGCPRVLYELMMLCWNPNTSRRPKFRDIFLVLIENESFILSLPQEAHETHQLSATLGAPLEAGEMMYRDLQNMYIPSFHVTPRYDEPSCDTGIQENEYDYI